MRIDYVSTHSDDETYEDKPAAPDYGIFYSMTSHSQVSSTGPPPQVRLTMHASELAVY